jgi:hypothetical protein
MVASGVFNMMNLMSFSGGGVVELVKNGLKSVGGRVRAFGRVSERVGARMERMEGWELMAAVAPMWLNAFGSSGEVGDLTGDNRVNDVVADVMHNVYVTGVFRGTVDFDFGAGVRNLTSTYGTGDGYVAKYNENGTLAWVSQFAATGEGGSVGGSAGRALAVSPGADKVYIAGSFTDSMKVDFVSGSTEMMSSGETDAFVATLTADGELSQIKQFYGTGSEEITHFVGWQDNWITIMGMSTGVVDLDVTSKEVNLAAPSGRTVSFVAQYDFSMNLNSYVATRGTGATGTSSFASGDISRGSIKLVVAANYQGTGELFTESGPLGLLTASGSGQETYVASFTMGSEKVNWGHSIVSTGSVAVSAVTTENWDEDVYFGLNVTGKVDLNPGESGAEAYLDAGTHAQMVIISLNRDGYYRGMSAAGPDGVGEIKEMIARRDPVDDTKSLVTAVGTFTGTVQLDPEGSAAGMLTSASPAGFVWHMWADGTLLEAAGFYAHANGIGMSETGRVEVTSVAVSNAGRDVILGGMFTGEADFDGSTGKTLVNSVSKGAVLDGFFGRFAISAPAPAIRVTGLTKIANNDLTPSVEEGTDFGVFTVGSEALSMTFMVANTGTAALSLSDFERPVGFELINGRDVTLEAGQAYFFAVTFGPSVEGTFGGNISFKTNVTGMETFYFAVAGKTKGSTDPVVLLPGIDVSFGGKTLVNGDATPSLGSGTLFPSSQQGAMGPTATFKIANDGDGELKVGSINVPAGFTLLDGFMGTIAAGGFEMITVGLSTGVIGSFAGDVTITTNMTVENPFHFRVEGKVVAPLQDFAIRVSADEEGEMTNGMGVFSGTRFGNENDLGGAGTTQSFVVTNAGSQILLISNFTLPAGLKVVDAIAASLLPGESDTFTLMIDTTVARVVTGSVWFETNVTGENPFHFSVEGEVVSPLPDFAMKLAADEEGQIPNGMDVFSGTRFGNGNYVGSAGTAQSFVVTNTGSQILLISNFKLPAGLKVVDAIAASLLPGESDTFTLMIDTTEARMVTGRVAFETNAPGNETFTFAVSGSVATNKGSGGTFTITSKSALPSRTFIDELGNKVVFALTGAGELVVEQYGAGNLLSLSLWGTDVKSGLVVTVTKDAKVSKSTGITTIGHVDVAEALGTFAGGSVNLTGGFKAQGTVKALTVNDLTGGMQQTVSIGGAYTDKTAMTLGRVSEATITTAGALTSFKAVEWVDNDSTADVLKADSLGAFSVTGRAKSGTLAAVAGDMMADITVAYGDILPGMPATTVTVARNGDGEWDFGSMKVNSLTVKGNATGKWSAVGFGAVNIGKNAQGLTVYALKVGAVTIKGGSEHFDLNAIETLGSLTVAGLAYLSKIGAGEKSGAISFGAMKESTVYGGDYLASVSSPTVAVNSWVVSSGIVGKVSAAGWQGGGFNMMGKVNAVTITGAVTESQWMAQGGGFGAISITGDVTGLVMEVARDLTSFKAGRVKNTTFDVGGAVGSVTVTEWQDGSVKAAKIGTITTKGSAATKLSGAVKGAFTGDLKVTGEEIAENVSALGGASIAGGLNGVEWDIFGKTGAITVGEARDTHLTIHGDLAGFTSKGWAEETVLSVTDELGAVSVINWLGGSIVAGKIASVTVKGQSGSKTVEAIAGNFSGSLNVGIGLSGLAVGALTLAGALTGTVDVFGSVGAVTVGSATDASIGVTDKMASFTSKGWVSGVALKSGTLGAVSAIIWLGGSIEAEKVGSVTIKGQAGSRTVEAVPGNFTGSLTVSRMGDPADAQAELTLGALTLAGGLGGAVDVTGRIGAVTVGGALGTSIIATGDVASFTSKGQVAEFMLESGGSLGAVTVGSTFGTRISATGDVASFTSKGQVGEFTLESGGSLGAVRSANWLRGSISADKVASITMTGQASTKSSPAIKGDFYAKVIVSGEGVGSKAVALGTVTISGTLVGSLLDVGGNVGAVTVGAMIHSTLLAGADEFGFKVLDEETKALSTLASFTVTGKAVGVEEASFVDSFVVAGTLTKVSLKLVDIYETDANGFIAGEKIVAYSRLTGLAKPNDVVKVANRTLSGVYDPVGGSEGIGYSVRIVG